MALNAAGYQTAGTPPGTSAAAGSYTPCTGANASFQGATQFTNGVDFLAYSQRQAGWVVSSLASTTIDSGQGNCLYSAPPSDAATMPLTGWTVSNGAAPAPTFAAIGSSGATLAPVSFTDALLSDTFLRSGTARAPVNFSDALLSDSLIRSGMTRAPLLFSDVFFTDALTTRAGTKPAQSNTFFFDVLFSDSFSAGPRNGALQAFADPLFWDTFSPQPVQFAPASFTDALFADSLTLRPRTFAAQVFGDPLFSDSGGRTGQTAPGGHTSPPFVFSDALLSDSLAAGPKNGGTRLFADALFSDALTRTGYARFAAFSDSLLSDRLTAFPVQGEAQGGVDDRDPFVVLAAELRLLLTLAQGNQGAIVSTLLSITDKIAAAYRVNDLSQAANILAELPTLIRGGDGVTSTVYGFGQDAPILALLPAAESLIAGSAPNVILAAQYRGFLSALGGYASSLKFPTFDAYLTSFNTPVPFQALVHPNFALLNWLFNNQQGPLLMSPGNVFAPQMTFGTALVGSGAGNIAFSHLSDIPSANVVNVVAGQSTQGYTAAPGVGAMVSQSVNGTLTVTLIGFGQNAAGAAVTGRTWTAVLDNAAAGSTIAFVPAHAGDRLHGITSLSGQGAATAGAFVLNSVLERVVS